jgi:hypothetical protein
MNLLRILVPACCGVLLALPVRHVAAEPVAAASDVDMNLCLRMAARQVRPDEKRCPGFIVSALADAGTMCREVGGRLRAFPQSALWAIDVNADGKPEYLFDTTQNVDCEGAPSVLGCGSSDCGLPLYTRKGNQWQVIGNLPNLPAAIEVVPGSGRDGFADLRTGCGEADCAEYQQHRWNGSAYDLAGYEVRGHAVDIPAERGQLWTLARDVAVLAEPRRGAKVLRRYKARTEVTEMVILGKARAAPFLYVSPCNACESGFVEPAALRRPARR